MNVRKRCALLTSALALTTVAAAAPMASAAPSGAAEACTAWRTIQVNNNAGAVKYRECDRYSGSNTQTRAEFYIWDNKHDGKSAQVYMATGSNVNGSWKQSWEKYYYWSDESKHSPKVNTGWHKGHDVKVLLKLV